MLRENDLTLVMLGLIMACLIGRGIGGFTGHFTEAVSENRESEFLQMGMLVFLAAFSSRLNCDLSWDPSGRHPSISARNVRGRLRGSITCWPIVARYPGPDRG